MVWQTVQKAGLPAGCSAAVSTPTPAASPRAGAERSERGLCPRNLGGRNRRGALPPSEVFLMLLAFLTVVGVFVSDLALAALDPRIRQGAERSR